MPEKIWYLFTLKLTGEATQAQLEEFHALLEANPDLGPSIQTLTLAWVTPISQETTTKKDSYKDSWNQHLKKLTVLDEKWIEEPVDAEMPNPFPQKSWYQSHRWLAAAAFIFVALSAAILSLIFPTKPFDPKNIADISKNEIVTRPASRSQLILPDGSKVWLNASSKLTYSAGFGDDNRNVWLEGEGYFQVFKNKSLPFIIHTSRMNIKVTGTVFNVRAYSKEKSSETSLIEGSVEIALAGEKEFAYQLKPNQKLVVNDQGVATGVKMMKAETVQQEKSASIYAASLQSLAKPLSDNQVIETAWVYNLLCFSDESFRQVADKMEKWYGVNIDFKDEGMENWRFTGSFKNESLTDALLALKVSTNFEFSLQSNHVFISKPNQH